MLNNKRINKSVALVGDYINPANKGFNTMDNLDNRLDLINRYQLIADAVKRIQGSK